MRHLAWLLTLLLVPSGTACTQAFVDPASDAFLLTGAEAPDFMQDPRLDFRGAKVERLEDRIHFSIDLGASPIGAEATYRYWLGWTTNAARQTAEYMGLRLAGTTTYDEAYLVASNQHGNVLLEMVPIHWSEARLEFDVDAAILARLYGSDFEMRGPILSSDGPFLLGSSPQGPIASAFYVQDRLDEDAAIPPPSCIPQAQQIAPRAVATPDVSWPLLLGCLILAALRRRE